MFKIIFPSQILNEVKSKSQITKVKSNLNIA